MRPIKYRFYDKRTGKHLEDCDMWWNYIEYTNKDEVIVCEFTGLKDKNGKEIYEGDILKQYDKTYEVYYINGHFMSCNELWEENTRSEVIGNIYENPELLGEKQ